MRRKLVDPARQELVALPADKNEMALMLAHNYCPTFDNLSGLQHWQSDMLCTASTGGGISRRQLFTDTEEVFLTFQHCPALNGINNPAAAPDLLDRAIILRMERIEPIQRREEADFWAAFEADRPYILAGMLTPWRERYGYIQPSSSAPCPGWPTSPVGDMPLMCWRSCALSLTVSPGICWSTCRRTRKRGLI